MVIGLNNIYAIAKKEFVGFFSSLTAFIFFGAFLAVTLFVFFWADPFFARNIADVRPMFEWMPLLLIFLVPALTMKMWAEERRSGTLELLMTSPISNVELVLGKFLACLALVALALALTFPLPITVGMFAGDLDWGPVGAGYVASIFLAAAYVAIGLYISAKTDNQIVSLIISCVVCGLFLIVGSDVLTSFFSSNISEVLQLLGSGARFQSISRGIIDFRDLYYYLSVAGVFLCLNVLGLERLRWASNKMNSKHFSRLLVALLCLGNLAVANLWLQEITWARVDVTEGQIYSISDATRGYLSKLQEPMIIRGYFSKRTHPLLAPLVPRLRDFLKEYAIAGKGKVHVEFVDPLENPDLEKEANEKYGIKPVVFQTANKYQNAISNSYFDVLVKYGDQFEKLGFRDLVEAKSQREGNLQVDLKNPEYDITSAIKKVMYAYQAGGNPFSGLSQPVEFTAYISPDGTLPKQLVALRRDLNNCLDDLKKEANGKLTVNFVDPLADGGKVAKQIESDYGFRPMVTNLINGSPFWFYMTMKSGDQVVSVPIPERLNKEGLAADLKSGLKRFTKGFLKTIGVYVPPVPRRLAPGQQRGNGLQDFNILLNKLGSAYSVRTLTLADGQVPPDIDLLIVVEPTSFDSKRVFAVDQFLMKGGTVMVATNPYTISVQDGLGIRMAHTGLDEWLKHNGINIETSLVLDAQNFGLPLPVRRKVGSAVVQETQLAPYPFFVDVRRDGMSSAEQITASLDQVNVDWASPISVDQKCNAGRHVIKILQSSPHSWTSSALDIVPNYGRNRLGFDEHGDLGRKLLAVAVEGRFESFFKGKDNPLLSEPAATDGANKNGADTPNTGNSANDQTITSVIEKSADSARLFVFSSPTFLSDRMQFLAMQTLGADYTKPADLILDAVDWSLQDRELLSIRGRGHYARPLRPLTPAGRMMLEYGNYALALAGLLVVWLVRRSAIAAAQRRYRRLLASLESARPVVEQGVQG